MNLYERNRQIYILRCKGFTLKEIAQIVKLSPERCRALFNRYKLSLEIEASKKQETPQLKDYEKQIIWALYQIKDDIKHLAEK